MAMGTDAAWRVVVNREGQRSIWPADLALAPGWTDVGVTGTSDACLDHIGRLWSDPRPPAQRRPAA